MKTRGRGQKLHEFVLRIERRMERLGQKIIILLSTPRIPSTLHFSIPKKKSCKMKAKTGIVKTIIIIQPKKGASAKSPSKTFLRKSFKIAKRWRRSFLYAKSHNLPANPRAPIRLLSMMMEESSRGISSEGDELALNNKPDVVSKTKEEEMNSPCAQHYRQMFRRVKKYFQFTCRICCHELEKSEVEIMTDCQHQFDFCKSCANIYFKLKLTTYETIYCPHENCKAAINIGGAFFTSLPQATQRRYRKVLASIEKLHDANFRTCPSEHCEGNITFRGNNFLCSTCSKKFCLNCLAPEHKGECYVSELKVFQEQLQLRRCPNCKFMIQRSVGCNYMKCRCKFEFCYGCNAPYTATHKCRTDQYGRAIIEKPVFKEEKIVDEEPLNNNIALKEGGIQENIILALFMLSFVIPLLTIMVAVFLLRMAARSILLLLQIAFLIIVMLVLGAGPFTLEFLRQRGKKTRNLLTGIYPITMFVGIYCSLAELSSECLVPLLRRFKTKGRQLWNHLLVELFE